VIDKIEDHRQQLKQAEENILKDDARKKEIQEELE
jgi:hypothetical protein